MDIHNFIIQNQTSAYIVLFFTTMGETATFFTGFLPTDSLIFALGSTTIKSMIEFISAIAIFAIASFIGNFLNYFTAFFIEKRIEHSKKKKWFEKENVKKSIEFYNKYGMIAVIIGRFLPVFRSFIPFISGFTKMDILKFAAANFIGSLLWSFTYVILGYFFGKVEFFKNNFWIIIPMSLVVPGVMAFLINKFIRIKNNKKEV